MCEEREEKSVKATNEKERREITKREFKKWGEKGKPRRKKKEGTNNRRRKTKDEMESEGKKRLGD